MSDHLDGMALIRAERQRQIEVEGWTPEHDREHGRDLLTRAANAYRWGDYHYWPWNRDGWKPKDHLSNLIRAGALYMAANEAADLDPESGSLVGLIAGEIDGILAKARAVLAAPVSSVPQGTEVTEVTGWRGVPPAEESEPEPPLTKDPSWSAKDFTETEARNLLTKHYGAAWTLERRVASWVPVDAEGSED